jgi:hypothetical protein
MMSNGGVMKTDPWDVDPFESDIMEQSITTVNATVQLDTIFQKRANCASKSSQFLIGTMNSLSIRGPDSMISVLSSEPCFSAKSVRTRIANRATNGASAANNSPWNVFSSWNGKDIQKYVEIIDGQPVYNDEAFRADYRLAGISMGDAMATGNMPDCGIALNINGSWSTKWNGKARAFPGDKFIIRPPSLDPVKRAEESPGHPTGKILGVFDVWNPNSIIKSISSSVGHLFDPYLISKLRVSRIHHADNRTSNQEKVAIALKQFILTSVASGISVLSDYGIVSVNLPDEMEPFSQTIYERNNRVLYIEGDMSSPMDLQTAREHHITSQNGLLNKVRLDSLSFEEVNNLKKKRLNDLLYLSVLTGAIDPKNEYLRSHTTITESILGSVLHSHIPSTATSDMYNPVSILSRNAAFVPSNLTQIYTPNLLELDGQFLKNSYDSFTNVVQAISHLILTASQEVAGVCLSETRPGRGFDYFLQI